jgi:hypothetical protein
VITPSVGANKQKKREKEKKNDCFFVVRIIFLGDIARKLCYPLFTMNLIDFIHMCIG